MIRCFETISEIVDDEASPENISQLINLTNDLKDNLMKDNDVKCTVKHSLMFLRICR